MSQRSSHDSFALGAMVGQILSTVQRIERKMDTQLRRKPPRWEARVKDALALAATLATLYATGSLHDAARIISVLTGSP